MADFFKRNAGLFTQRAPGTKQAPANPLAMQPAIGGLGGGAPGGGPMGAPMPPQAGAPGTPPIGGYDEPGSLLQFVDPQQTGQAPAGGGGLNDMAARAASLMPSGQAAAGATGGMGFTGGPSDPWAPPGFGPDMPDPMEGGGYPGQGPVSPWNPSAPGDDPPRRDESQDPRGGSYGGQWGGGGDHGIGWDPAHGDPYSEKSESERLLDEIRSRFGDDSFDPIEQGIERQRDQAARNMFEGMAGRGMSQSGVQAGMMGDVYQKGWQDIAQARTQFELQQNQQMMGVLEMMLGDKWRALDRAQQIAMMRWARDNEWWLIQQADELQESKPGEIEGMGDDILESLKFWKWKFR